MTQSKYDILSSTEFDTLTEPLGADAVQALPPNIIVSRDAGNVADQRLNFGERLADRVAAVGGSWGFIITFSGILLCWMLLNSGILAHFGMTFDPYPYIFLNLMLSTLAALQAPVIMMSQNRSAMKDRIAAGLDFNVNLRTELELQRLHKKIDQVVAERLDLILLKLEDNRKA